MVGGMKDVQLIIHLYPEISCFVPAFCRNAFVHYALSTYCCVYTRNALSAFEVVVYHRAQRPFEEAPREITFQVGEPETLPFSKAEPPILCASVYWDDPNGLQAPRTDFL